MNPTEALSVKTLAKLKSIDQAVFESLEQMLYRLLVQVDNQWYYVEKNGQSLLARNLFDLQKLLLGKTIGQLYLKHSSPYDEMIGVDTVAGQNTLLVPIGMPSHLIN